MLGNTRPEVSIVVACYNHAYYLEECLTSIKAQTYPHWRVVVVDDASSDGELIQPIIDRINDARIRLVRHEINRGPSAARNTGIRESSTELFVSVDADDRLDPVYLERLVPAIWNDQTLDCVFPDVRLIGAEDRIIAYDVPPAEEILHSQAIPGAGTMMRRRLWERLGGYDEADVLRRGREDWEFYIRAFTSGCRADHIAEPLYLYRIKNTSLSITCRLHDDTVAKYIYDKHRAFFDSAGEGRRFLSFGFAKSALAWNNHGFRGRSFPLALKAWQLDPSGDRLKLLIITMLPPFLARRLQRGEIRRFIPFWGHPLKGVERYKPFFIIGAGRSGTTLLRRILTAHSELHIPPENFELSTSIEKFRQYRQLTWSDLVHLIMSLFEFHHEFYTFEVSLRPLVNQLLNIPKKKRNLAFILDSFYRYHSVKHGRSILRWGDKTPLNTLLPNALELILKVFPDAQFIHIVRNGNDVVSSALQHGFFTDITAAANRWVQTVQNARRFTHAHADKSIEIRYEDLVSQPEVTIQSVCLFLNVKYEPRMLTSEDLAMNMGDVPFLSEHREVTKPINTSNIGKASDYLSAQDKEILEAIIGRELELFGYPACTP